MGAEVIKVEPPGGSSEYKVVNDERLVLCFITTKIYHTSIYTDDEERS
jgi:crotonobetainyl-CoA:carnitine CoA-transferase CaiB-like acyl-CoA transferase